jgi:hypothetical protein
MTKMGRVNVCGKIEVARYGGENTPLAMEMGSLSWGESLGLNREGQRKTVRHSIPR